MENNIARLRITCPDQPGIVARVSNFIYQHGANITALDQHSSDPEGGQFFMRLEFQTPHLDVSRATLAETFAQQVAAPYQMDWHLNYAADVKKIAILVSQADHALLELLWRWNRGELEATITQVISNHETLRSAVENFGVPFHYVKIDAQDKGLTEKKILALLKDQTDCLVLARYMQILSEDFIAHYPNAVINIHHSFLPAFAGAQPYQQAYDKGVKLIGATAHYVTKELDMGPIIDQDIARVSHRDGVNHLQEKGRDVERNVLARAVKWHLEDRIIVDGHKTIVFV